MQFKIFDIMKMSSNQFFTPKSLFWQNMQKCMFKIFFCSSSAFFIPHGYTFPTRTLKGSILKNRQLPMWQVTFLVSIFQIFRMVASVTDILDAFNSNICLVFSVFFIAQGSSILKKCSQFREYSWILYFQLEMKKCTLQTWLTNSVWLYRCRYRWVFKQPV